MLKLTRAPRLPGASQITINIDYDGIPFGQLFTFRNTRTDKFGWTAKLLNGKWRHFSSFGNETSYSRTRSKNEALEQAIVWVKMQAAESFGRAA